MATIVNVSPPSATRVDVGNRHIRPYELAAVKAQGRLDDDRLSDPYVLWDVIGVWRSGNKDKDSSATLTTYYYQASAGVGHNVQNVIGSWQSGATDGAGDIKRAFPVSHIYYDEGFLLPKGWWMRYGLLRILLLGTYTTDATGTQNVTFVIDRNGNVVANHQAAGTPDGTPNDGTGMVLMTNATMPISQTKGFFRMVFEGYALGAGATYGSEQLWSAKIDFYSATRGTPTTVSWTNTRKWNVDTVDSVVGVRFGKQGLVADGTNMIEVNRCIVTLQRPGD